MFELFSSALTVTENVQTTPRTVGKRKKSKANATQSQRSTRVENLRRSGISPYPLTWQQACTNNRHIKFLNYKSTGCFKLKISPRAHTSSSWMLLLHRSASVRFMHISTNRLVVTGHCPRPCSVERLVIRRNSDSLAL